MESNKKEKISLKQSINNKLAKMKEEAQINREINGLINDWKDIMYELKLHTETLNTFTLINIKKENYGFSSTIYATKGMNLEDLEKCKPNIETGLGCIFLYNKKKGSKTAEAKFITNGFGGNNIKFIPPKTSPFELYLGNSVDGSPVIISVKDVSHFLLSGSNGSGKSRMLDCMLTTLIYNCDETELELYLAQISKNDLIIYEDAKCCRAFCETLDEVEAMLKHCLEKMNERDKLIKPMRKDFKGSNISDYNKLHPDRKLSVCWIIFDELASVMNKNGNSAEVKKQKENIIAMMELIARVGRALGIFLGCCLQRPKAESLSPDIKSQANLRISFSQNNSKSSEVAMDDAQIAVGLDERVAVYSCRATGYDFVKTPYIDDKVIEKYVKPVSQRGHRNLFTDLKKIKKNFETIKSNSPQTNNNGTTEIQPIPPTTNAELPNLQNIEEIIKRTLDAQLKTPPKKITEKEKEVSVTNSNETIQNKPIASQPKIKYEEEIIPIKFDKVDPEIKTKEVQELHENIKAIDNFVPYIDYSKFKKVKIIDQTKISSKTEKPKKSKE